MCMHRTVKDIHSSIYTYVMTYTSREPSPQSCSKALGKYSLKDPVVYSTFELEGDWEGVYAYVKFYASCHIKHVTETFHICRK